MIVGILQEARVKLLAKFNLVLIVIFAVGMGLIAHNAYNFLMEQARQAVLQQAELMSADATRDEGVHRSAGEPDPGKDAGAQRPFSAADDSFLRGECDLSAAALEPSGIHDAGGGAEPDQPGRPGDGVGGGPDQLFPRQSRAEAARGRPGHADGPGVVRRRADHGRSRMPCLPQRASGCAARTDPALRRAITDSAGRTTRLSARRLCRCRCRCRLPWRAPASVIC